MKIKLLHCLLYLMFLPIVAFSQTNIKDVPLVHEQVVLNDKIKFSIIGTQVVDSIVVFHNVIKPVAGMQLVVVKLSYRGENATKFILRPNDFVAVYGDISVYMITSIAVGPGSSWITNEFEESSGKMSVVIDVIPGINKDGIQVAFKLPKTITAFSVMSKTISSLGNISIL
jgi:hypothetical protein